jgi:AcrR family transcriptional regulator
MATDVQDQPLAYGPEAAAAAGALGLGRDRPTRSLLDLRRGGFVSAAQVSAMQRAFLLDAVAEAAGERGYRQLGIADVCTRAGVSRRTFYDLFSGLDECFLAAVAATQARVAEAARVGYASGGRSWTSAVRASVVEVLALLDAQPAAGPLLAQSVAGPPEAARAQQALLADLAAALSATAAEAGATRTVPDRVARGLVAGAWMIVQDHLAADGGAPLLPLAAEITHLLAGPYQGASAATRQLHVAPAPPVRDWRPHHALPEEGVRWQAEVAGEGMRKQILRFLVDRPGATNVAIGAHVGASESTMSRRLADMARNDLIASTKRAGRNAWHVTDVGRALVG